ncbi:hypothetical protein, partial [Aliikangiella maris]
MNSWYVKSFNKKDKSLGQIEVNIKTYWRPYKDSPLNFINLNQFTEELIENFYNLTSESEENIYSSLEDSYKVVKTSPVMWLIKDIYRYSYLLERRYQTVLSDQVVLSIAFIRYTDFPLYSREINEYDMIENWNQAEKAFM